jgi:hypothetical protein
MFGKPKINRVAFFFNSYPHSLGMERAMEEVIKFFKLSKQFTKDVDISSSIDRVPGVDESFAMNGLAQSLFLFATVRATLLGFSQKEIGNMRALPFRVAGTDGVVLVGHMKDVKDTKVKT